MSNVNAPNVSILVKRSKNTAVDVCYVHCLLNWQPMIAHAGVHVRVRVCLCVCVCARACVCACVKEFCVESSDKAATVPASLILIMSRFCYDLDQSTIGYLVQRHNYGWQTIIMSLKFCSNEAVDGVNCGSMQRNSSRIKRDWNEAFDESVISA